MKLKLSEFFLYLLQRKPLFGRLVNSLNRVAKPGIGTMAVGVRDGRATFFYDPEFIESIDLSSALFALEHEMLHLVLDHIPRFLELLAVQPNELERKKAGAVYNIAMDCSINTMLRNHEGFVTIQTLMDTRMREKHPDLIEDKRNGMVLPEKFDLPMEASFEAYQYLLMRKVEVVEVACRLVGGSDHSMWARGEAEGEGEGKGEGEGDTPGQGKGGGKGKGKNGKGPVDITFDNPPEGMTSDELMSQAHRVREQIKNTLRNVVKSMGGIGRGTLPGNIEEFLELYLKDPIIPWFELFSSRAKMSRLSKYDRSSTQPNRTLQALAEEDDRIIPMPGRVRNRSWRVFLMVDTSGSMSSESLLVAKSELQHMLAVEENMEIRYMEGDADVHTDVVLHQGDEIPTEVVGRGGTDFTSYFKYMHRFVGHDDKAPDIVVVYTDGYAPPVDREWQLPNDIPVIWLVTPQYGAKFNHDYGEVIICDPDQSASYNG